MYDPARDTFVTEEAPPSSSPAHSHTHSHSQHPSSPPIPHPGSPTFAPPPLKLSQQLSTVASAPTPGGFPPQPFSSPAEMNISFDFDKPASAASTAPTPGRRMSSIDDLLSPAPGGHGGGFFSNNAPTPEVAAKPKLPSFKRKRDAVGDGAGGAADGQRGPPAYRGRDDSRGERDQGDNRRGERDPGDNRRGERDPGDNKRSERGGDTYRDGDRGDRRDRERDWAQPRRRSRSPARREGRITRGDRYHRRSRSPPPPSATSASTLKFPPRPNSPPAHLRLLSSLLREPSPPPPPRSPPRGTRRRPGAASRLTTAEREAARQLQEKRDAEEALRKKLESDPHANLAVEDVVRSHYNERPEMGKVWRVESSRIRGLRALNNWIKSCIIHKFSPNPEVAAAGGVRVRYGGVPEDLLCVLDIGCGKGGDLRKWKLAPQEVGNYVGVDTAEVSVAQARDRYESMVREERPPPWGAGGYRRPPPPRETSLFRADFVVRDCWVDCFYDVQCIKDLGFDDSVTPAGARGGGGRWNMGGGFDVVSMMFCLHYAFETEAKARRMLANVAGALKKGGRFVGTIPSSDVIKDKLGGWVRSQEKALQEQQGEGREEEEGEEEKEEGEERERKDEGEDGKRQFSWGNSIYKVTFQEDTLSRILPLAQPPPSPTPNQPSAPPTTITSPTTNRGSSSPPYVPGCLSAPSNNPPPKPTWDQRFRPPFGWRYQYHLDEAVEDVPEYIVPWESFRALCEEFNLELVYKRGFHDIWREEGRRDGELARLSERMGVRERGWRPDGGREGGSLKEREGGLGLTEEEWEACGFYVAFAFRKS